HDVDVAYDGAVAVERARATLPDVVFLDLRMPKMDGMTAARHLRALPGGAAAAHRRGDRLGPAARSLAYPPGRVRRASGEAGARRSAGAAVGVAGRGRARRTLIIRTARGGLRARTWSGSRQSVHSSPASPPLPRGGGRRGRAVEVSIVA